jgi:hypothetical protein
MFLPLGLAIYNCIFSLCWALPSLSLGNQLAAKSNFSERCRVFSLFTRKLSALIVSRLRFGCICTQAQLVHEPLQQQHAQKGQEERQNHAPPPAAVGPLQQDASVGYGVVRHAVQCAPRGARQQKGRAHAGTGAACTLFFCTWLNPIPRYTGGPHRLYLYPMYMWCTVDWVVGKLTGLGQPECCDTGGGGEPTFTRTQEEPVRGQGEELSCVLRVPLRS